MSTPKEVAKLIESAGGKIDSGSEMTLPDGSGCLTASFPLPEDHWLTQPGRNDPPTPLLMGTDDPRRSDWNAAIRKAARYAIRASTMNGAEIDFDPDAMVQNFVVAMLGYHTPNGLSDA